MLSAKSKAFKRYAFDMRLKDKNLAVYDSVKAQLNGEDKGEWHEYQNKDGIAVYTRDESVEQGSGIHGIYLNAKFDNTTMLTLIGCNAEVDLLQEWIPGIDGS